MFNTIMLILLLFNQYKNTGGIHLCEARRRFLEGSLHPANVLMCPHTCVTNLPKPRELHQGTYFIFKLIYYYFAIHIVLFLFVG